MKIAILSQSYPPMLSGAAIVAERLATGLAQRDHELLVVTASESGPAYTQMYSPHLRVERLAAWPNPARVNQRYMPWPYHATLRSLQAFKPDLIHTHEPFLLNQAALAYRRRSRVPVLLTVHQLPWFVSAYLKEFPWLARSVERLCWAYASRLLRQVDSAVTPTTTIAQLIAERTGIQPQIISNGIDLCDFNAEAPPAQLAQARLRLGIPPGAPVILHVGRLDKDKQVEIAVAAALQAMQQPGAQSATAHLLVVGDGTVKARLMALCRQAAPAGSLESRCHFPGFVSAQQGLGDLYRLADVFITASEIETQGIVLMEAAACGLPVVAVRAGSVPEMVCDGESGYLCQPGDVAGLAVRLAQLLNQPCHACRLGQNGRAMMQKHTLSCSLDAYEDLYQQMLNRSAQPQPGWYQTDTWTGRAKRSGGYD